MIGSARDIQSVKPPEATTAGPDSVRDENPPVTKEVVLADFARNIVEYGRDKFGISQDDCETLVQMIEREFDESDKTPGMGGGMENLDKPGHAHVTWPFYVLAAGLLAVSLVAGWPGLAFMTTLLGLGLISHMIWRTYVRQSHTSKGVGAVIRALETLREYLADEDPPTATANRIDSHA
jgi:hypothetical protein